tara:strand:- start:55 stop:348 length:294 start_codon:yes stop_codon:yes gene_type:complete
MSRHCDTTPEALKSCLAAIRRSLALVVMARAYRLIWEPCLAVVSLDRKRKHVTLSLPMQQEAISYILDMALRDKLDVAIPAAGLKSWEITGEDNGRG